MEKASKLLIGIKEKIFFHKRNQSILSEVIFTCLNIKIDSKNFLIKKETVYIKCASVIKNEIIFNKEKIISLFYEKGGTIKILNIK
jgi:hypothetical protein